MSDISFEDNSFKFKSRTILSESTVPGLTRFLLKKGIVKNEKQANIFMICMSIIFFCLAVYVFASYVFGYRFYIKKDVQINYEHLEMTKDYIQQIKKNSQNTQNAQ